MITFGLLSCNLMLCGGMRTGSACCGELGGFGVLGFACVKGWWFAGFVCMICELRIVA